MKKTRRHSAGSVRSGTNCVAVVVAHPDDEVLGFGGAIARHADAGHHVEILVLATGLSARTGKGRVSASQIAALQRQARAASDIMGAASVSFAGFPDNAMDSVPLLNIVKEIERFFAALQPKIIYTHHAGDLNIDHAIAARAVMTASRPLPGANIAAIYAGEVLSSTEWGAPSERFVPRRYVEVTDQLERKLKAMAAYKDELCQFPHPRSLEGLRHLAAVRGTECGVPAAEAFDVVREVIRNP